MNVIKTILDTIWNDGHKPEIVVDATHADVVVPDHVRLKYDDHLRIDLDVALPMNIVFTEEGIAADLSFNMQSSRCFFPWRRIYLVIDMTAQHGALIHANKPKGAIVETDPVPGPAPAPTPQASAPKFSLRSIKGGKSN